MIQTYIKKFLILDIYLSKEDIIECIKILAGYTSADDPLDKP
ncbi:Uncharacterised protein [Campylobacter hyointestinalis]|nr:Uncharacterised protein [Campylobacter hyointestinalis]